MSRPLNWLLAGLLGFTLGASHLLDGPDDMHTEWAISQDLLDAQAAAQKQSAFDAWARSHCGNAPWTEREDGSIVCQPRRGIKGGQVVGGL